MCVSIQIEECQQLGFTIAEKPDGGISVKGPRKYAALAKRVLECKADVLAAIRKQASSFSTTTGVNVSETSRLPGNNEVSLMHGCENPTCENHCQVPADGPPLAATVTSAN